VISAGNVLSRPGTAGMQSPDQSLTPLTVPTRLHVGCAFDFTCTGRLSPAWTCAIVIAEKTNAPTKSEYFTDNPHSTQRTTIARIAEPKQGIGTGLPALLLLPSTVGVSEMTISAINARNSVNSFAGLTPRPFRFFPAFTPSFHSGAPDWTSACVLELPLHGPSKT
jgi:hypothetical protein